jgi:hypothetical protein
MVTGSEKPSRWRWLLAVPATVAGVVAVGAQVGPSDATKHLTDWATFLGLSWPSWLSAGKFFAGVAIALAIFYSIVYRVPLERAYRALRNRPPVPLGPTELPASTVLHPADGYSQLVKDLKEQHALEKADLQRQLVGAGNVIETLADERDKQQGEVMAHKAESNRAWTRAQELQAQLETQRKIVDNRAVMDDGHKQGVLKTRKSDKPEPPPRPSEDDRLAIRELRQFWNLQGRDAVSDMARLFHYSIERLEGRDVEYGSLLQDKLRSLEKSHETMDKSLADDTTDSLDLIRGNLKTAAGSYLTVCGWVAVLRAVGAADFRDERLDAGLRNWQRAHKALMTEAEKLNETPEHRGTLFFWPHPVADERLKAFLREAFPGE